MANISVKAFDADGMRLDIVKEYFDSEGVLNVIIGGSVDKEEPCVPLPEIGTCQCADDDISRIIRENGHIENARLFRRFVLAQMFRYIKRARQNRMSLEKIIRRNGSTYRWKMLLNEFKAQREMLRNHDMESFRIRHSFFNGRLVAKLIREHVNVHSDLRRPVADIYEAAGNKKMYGLLRDAARNAYESEMNHDEAEKIGIIINSILEFRKYGRKTLRSPYSLNTGNDFYDAFIRCGFFYTFDNLIKFHGCRFVDMDERQSLEQSGTLTSFVKDSEQLISSLKVLLESTEEFKGFVAKYL